MSEQNPAPVPVESGSNLKIPILFGSVIALLGANIYLYTQLDGVKTDFAEFRKSTATELNSLKDTTNVSTQTARRSLTSLKDELEAARRQAAMAAGQAKSEALKHAEELSKKLSVEQARQDKAQQEMKSEITEVNKVASTATSKIGEVSTEVGSVKTEVAANKSELEKTISDLRRVNGDLGVQSGLVATNGKELAALKTLGERHYFEFTPTKSKDPRKVGDVSMTLNKADPKRNKYTLDLVAHHQRVENKDNKL